MCFPILLFPHHLSLRFRKQRVCYCWIRAGWAIVHFGNPIRLWCPNYNGSWGFQPMASPPAWTSNLCSGQPPVPFPLHKDKDFKIKCQQCCPLPFSSNNFLLLLFINFKLKFNLIKYTGKLLDSNKGWEWKYLSMLLLANLPESDIFQRWRKFLKGKGDRGSYSLPTACYQPSDKRSKHKELEREWEWWKHSSLPIAPDASSLVILRRAFWWCNTWQFS